MPHDRHHRPAGMPRHLINTLELGLTAEYTTRPSPKPRLAYGPPHHSYPTPVKGGTSSGCKRRKSASLWLNSAMLWPPHPLTIRITSPQSIPHENPPWNGDEPGEIGVRHQGSRCDPPVMTSATCRRPAGPTLRTR